MSFRDKSPVTCPAQWVKNDSHQGQSTRDGAKILKMFRERERKGGREGEREREREGKNHTKISGNQNGIRLLNSNPGCWQIKSNSSKFLGEMFLV